jgi:hypothetical protein
MLKYSYDSSGNLISCLPRSGIPPQITGQPLQQIIEPGQDATFSVVVADAFGVTFQWRFNNANIPGATGDSLVLNNVGAANAGNYSVVVTNSAGTVTSAQATLTIGIDRDGSAGLRLAAYSDAGGSVTLAPMKMSYSTGDTVTLTATPFAPSAFVGWTGHLSGNSNPATLTMNENKAVRARFAAPVPLAPGLIAFWRGERDANDLIGGHHGTLKNGAGFAAGKVGQAFSLDGIDDYIEIVDARELRPASVTVEAWVSLDFGSGLQHIFGKTVGNGRFDSFALWFDGPSLNAAVGYDGNFAPQLSIQFFPVLGRWYHVAYTFDDITKQQALYLDGRQVAAGTATISIGYDAHPVLLGADIDSGAIRYFLKGRIDEAALYSRALTMNEIADIYNADFVGKNVTNPYVMTPTRLPDAVVGAQYATQLSAVIGSPAYHFFLVPGGTFPPGLRLSTGAGLIDGIPTFPGIFHFAVAVTDRAGNTTEHLSVLQVTALAPFPRASPDLLA